MTEGPRIVGTISLGFGQQKCLVTIKLGSINRLPVLTSHHVLSSLLQLNNSILSGKEHSQAIRSQRGTHYKQVCPLSLFVVLKQYGH